MLLKRNPIYEGKDIGTNYVNPDDDLSASTTLQTNDIQTPEEKIKPSTRYLKKFDSLLGKKPKQTN